VQSGFIICFLTVNKRNGPVGSVVILQSAEVEDELSKCRQRLIQAENAAEDFRTRLELMEIAHEEKINVEKAKIVQILEAGFNERQKLGMLAARNMC
jgi:hypothetical protein